MADFRFKAFAMPFIAVALSALLVADPTKHQIYPDQPHAQSEIDSAIRLAARHHKRVILDFGGNWCGDCHALDKLFHSAPNSDLLKKNFVLVDVNIGKMDMNLDVAKNYDVPLSKGVPALAVLDEKGTLIYSQKNGEFEAMRRMDPSSVTTFLNEWKAKSP